MQASQLIIPLAVGDPPRRWAWVTFGTVTPPKYLALYDMNNCSLAQLQGFIGKVKTTMEQF
jgi:NAD(P)H dehydrogenase (quinone)